MHRRTAIPRATVSRVMRVLTAMGLLTYGSGGSWSTVDWPQEIEATVLAYEMWLRSRWKRKAPPRLDNGPQKWYTQGVEVTL